jgi:hypothetical protein
VILSLVADINILALLFCTKFTDLFAVIALIFLHLFGIIASFDATRI